MDGLKYAKKTHKKWTNAELEFLKSYYEMKPAKEIANKLNRTVVSIYRKANRLGLKSKTTGGGRLFSDKEIEFLKENYKDMRVRSIAEKLNRTKWSIQAKANKLGLRKRENYFNKSKTEDLAYVLGVCFGDGTVGNYPELRKYSISLEVVDKPFAKAFRKSLSEIGLDSFFWMNKVPNYRNEWNVLAYSKQFVVWFYSLGLDGTKKFLESSKMKKQFIKGVYDSDGCLCNYMDKGYKRSVVSICMANEELVRFIDNSLENIDIDFCFNVKSSDKNLYELRSASKKEVIRFLKKIGSNIHRRSLDSFLNWHKGTQNGKKQRG